MNDYICTANVFDGGFERHTQDVCGNLWRLWFKGTVFLCPKALADAQQTVLMGSSVAEDLLTVGQSKLDYVDVGPTIAYDWLVDSHSHNLILAFADLQPKLLEGTIRVNGIREADGQPPLPHVHETIRDLSTEATLAILRELPTVRQ